MQRTPEMPARTPAAAVPAHGRTVEVWVRRTPENAETEHPCVERVRRLAREGYADDIFVREWDRMVFLREAVAPRDRLAQRRVAEFREWAEATGAKLPAFDREARVGTGRMGPEHDAQFLPPVVVTVFEDGILTNVLPHVRGGETVTVSEWLNRVSEDGRVVDPIPVS